jgi:hypothetical protein
MFGLRLKEERVAARRHGFVDGMVGRYRHIPGKFLDKLDELGING